MNEVIDIKVLDNYQIWIRFKDGIEKIINIQKFLGKGISKELLEYENFKKVSIEPGGGIAWYNGFDFCPNYLKEL
ncbi:MAG: DUF2442 domain-containing protein [Bacteroidota bacterium]|nr:DUF2442 domain-containing protein [Bacteroidota bacterium]